MKREELKRKYSDITGPYYGYNEANEAFEELKAENTTLQAENDRLKAKLEDASTRERRLYRALYKACANWAFVREVIAANFIDVEDAKKWAKVETKCLKKAEKYK